MNNAWALSAEPTIDRDDDITPEQRTHKRRTQRGIMLAEMMDDNDTSSTEVTGYESNLAYVRADFG